jgi:Acetamidase/Formamidase family
MQTKRWLIFVVSAVAVLVLVEVPWAKTTRIAKTGFRCADDSRCHNRWHPAIKAVATAEPGDMLIYETRDALDHAFTKNSTAADWRWNTTLLSSTIFTPSATFFAPSSIVSSFPMPISARQMGA